MVFKRLISLIITAAVMSNIPISMAYDADTYAPQVLKITGIAQLRAETKDFDKYVTMSDSTRFIASNQENVQIFSNPYDAENNKSQCGAYYRYELPEYNSAEINLTFESSGNYSRGLKIIPVGTEFSGDKGSETYTIDNVFKDVAKSYTSGSEPVKEISYQDGTYTVDISSISHPGTNAVFIYCDDQASKIYGINNASISMEYERTVWNAAAEKEDIWSLSASDRINGYANILEDNSIYIRNLADNDENLYEEFKTEFDNADFKSAIPQVNNNICNIMGLVAKAGSSSSYILEGGKEYTLHYTIAGEWKNCVGTSPNGSYVNISTWTSTSKRIDNLTNKNIVSESPEAEKEQIFSFTPTEDSYGQFIFEMRRVEAGGYITVSDIYVTTIENKESTIELGDSSATETPQSTQPPYTDPVVIPTAAPADGVLWSRQWSYDFNEFTSPGEFSQENKDIPLTGEIPHQPPQIEWKQGILKSADGALGKPAGDYCLEIKSTATSGEPVRILYDLSSFGDIDTSTECLVSSQEVAFTNTAERRYVGSYRIASTPYNALIFGEDGYIKYYDNNGKTNYIIDSGNEKLTYNSNTWYNVTIRYDFKNNKVVYFLNGSEIASHKMLEDGSDARYQFEEVSYKGVMNASDPATAYLDNITIYKEQVTENGYLDSWLTSPANKTYLSGTEIKIEGKVNDGSPLNGKLKTEIYIDDNLKATVNENSYSITAGNIENGEHTVKALTTTEDGRSIEKTQNFKVANYQMPSTYSDGMVLQRNKDIKISGFAKDGEEILVSLNGLTKTDIAVNGRFEVVMPPQNASKSAILTISSGNISTEYETAIGEVILCNGQSNMAYTLGRFTELHKFWDKDYEDIHLFKQENTRSSVVNNDIPSGKWTKATRMEALYFSAFGYGIGQQLYEALNEEVPVGLIYAAIGGTSINIWVPKGAFDHDPDLYAVRNNGTTAYNAMVAPLTDYTIGYVVWYQGEADTVMTYNYEKMLTRYIDSLRTEWEDEDLPFVIVLLPIFNYQKQYGDTRTAVGVREAQWNVSQRLKNVETLVAIDTGNASDIHPNDKSLLCERASRILQHFIDPNSGVQYKSPSVESYEYNEDQKNITITFKDTYGALKTEDGQAPRGFKVAGDDNQYKPAVAEISGDKIIIDTSSVIGTPKVRYAWEDTPELEGNSTTLNLQNSAGFAAPPFRTDKEKISFNSSGEPVNFVPMVRMITADDILTVNENGVQKKTTYITVDARDYDGDIADVEVFVDGVSIGSASSRINGSETHYAVLWDNALEGEHEIHAVITDNEGGISTVRDSSLGSQIVEPYDFMSILEKGTEVNFQSSKQSFDQSGSEAVDAYFYTSKIDGGNNNSVRLGVTCNDETKYLNTIINGNTSVCFGVISEQNADIKGIAEQYLE